MNNLRCHKCQQLQFKWEAKQDIIKIEIKCYACNSFTNFEINLSTIAQLQNDQKVDIIRNNKINTNGN